VGIALFVFDFWYFSSRKSTRKINFTSEDKDSTKKVNFLKNHFSFPFVLIQKEQKIKPARKPRPLCQLVENTISVVPHQWLAHKPSNDH